jgi:hypothetical protein
VKRFEQLLQMTKPRWAASSREMLANRFIGMT